MPRHPAALAALGALFAAYPSVRLKCLIAWLSLTALESTRDAPKILVPLRTFLLLKTDSRILTDVCYRYLQWQRYGRS